MTLLETNVKNGLIGIEKDGERIVNLCPHSINILSPFKNGDIIAIPQSGAIARVDHNRSDIEKHAGFPITREVYGEVYGLPDAVDGTIYIVSAPVINVLNDSRHDVVTVGKQMKNEYGKSVAAISFRRQF